MDNLTIKTKFSYAMGSIGANLAYSIVAVFLMYYYTDVVGLSAAFVGALFFFARFFDAFTDPIMGMIVDNTKTRFGKFRPWLIIGALLNSVLLIVTFSAHLIPSEWLIVYATISYVLWGITFTIIDIPFWSMVPAITRSRDSRESLVVWLRLAASLVAMTFGAYGLKMAGFFGGADLGRGFEITSYIVIALFVICMFVMAINVKEVPVKQKKTARFNIKDVARIIISNDQLVALIGLVLAYNCSFHFINGFAIYYFSYALGNPEYFAIFMVVSGAAEVLGVYLFPRLSKLITRRRMWYLACIFPVICSCILFVTNIVDAPSAFMIASAGAAFKMGIGLANGLSTVMLADVVDYGEAKNGVRSEAIIFSIQTMLAKSSSAFGGLAIGLILSALSYIPQVDQSVETVNGMKATIVIIPVILMVVSTLVYWKFYKMKDGFNPGLKDSNLIETGKEVEAC
ncbi:melibiose:sodium transporter MelB [Vibrio maritimus]|uniref:melibiose:sodium transporter MelB n=1 Tax=Vibrio maritimus TaxID=990268 RepID=UPI0037358BFF